MVRPYRLRAIARGVALIVLSVIGWACVPMDVREGQSGPVAWEILDKEKTQFGWTFTVLLRETTGVGIQFRTVRIAFPLPPESQGMAWYGGARERAFARRLDPRAETRETFSAPFFIDTPEHADLEFRGTDDTGQAIRVPVRVYLRQGRRLPALPRRLGRSEIATASATACPTGLPRGAGSRPEGSFPSVPA